MFFMLWCCCSCPYPPESRVDEKSCSASLDLDSRNFTYSLAYYARAFLSMSESESVTVLWRTQFYCNENRIWKNNNYNTRVRRRLAHGYGSNICNTSNLLLTSILLLLSVLECITYRIVLRQLNKKNQRILISVWNSIASAAEEEDTSYITLFHVHSWLYRTSKLSALRAKENK